jgi:PAS domain S-box-containing protein
MQKDLFHLDFTRWEVILLFIIPSLINFGILSYVTFTFKKTKTHVLFSIFVFLLGMWQLSEGFMRLSVTENTALNWSRISEMFLILTVPAGVLFVFRLTKWEQKIPPNLISFIFLFPAVIFLIFVEAHYDSYTLLQSKEIYWIANPDHTPFTITLLLWITSGILSMFIVLWVYYFKNRKNTLKRNLALLLASGITFPVIGGIVRELIYPLLFNYNDLPIAAPLLTLFSISILIAIKKYKILDFSPKHHWEQIILNEGLLIVNNHDEIMYANQTFCILTEYLPNEIEGKIASLLFLENKDQRKFANINEDVNTSVPIQYEIELKTKTGAKKWVLVNGSPYIDGRGKVVGSIAVLTDITFLKIAEKELVTNENRLKNAQKVAHVGSWELDLKTKKAIWSEEACRIYCISPEEKYQSFESWLSFIHPEDLEEVIKEKERAEATLSNSSFKHRIICRSGKIKYIHSASEFEYDDKGQPVRLIGVCHDVTKEVTAEKAFIESEDMMSTFMNESLLCIFYVDPDTKKITYSNSSVLQLLGYTNTEMDSLTVYDFVNHPKEDVDARIEEVVMKAKIGNGEREWKRKDGQIIHVLVSSFYVNRKGKKTIIVAAQDVSERKKTEETLKTTNQELETFIYRASHDLRGPLASIIGLANLSKLEIKDELSLKYLSMIGTGTEKLDYTLTELVKAMEIKNINEFNNEIDFGAMINESLNKFEFFPGYSRLNIKTNISIKNTFRSNKFILETIIQNLIENAIKYQNYAAPESFLNINISQNREGINILVEDNGLGIEQSIQDRIFDMYFRGASDLKGSGLGLYLVKKGVEKLNGRIHLSSTKGEGAAFSIKFLSNNPIFLN